MGSTVSSDVADPGRATPAFPPEYDRLEAAVRRLGDEYAGYRARARLAEARAGELERALRDVSSGSLDPLSLRDRIRKLEQENRDLRRQMVQAQDRVRRLIARFDFLREDM
jgi:predicted RNase H-like nuclease (RuvC/YqgF family)